MATPTTRVAAPATSPAAITTPVRGKMVFELKKLAQPLELDQVVRDPTWDKFKTFMVYLGGIETFVAILLMGAIGTLLILLTLWWFGSFSVSMVGATQQPPTATQQPVTPMVPPVQQNTAPPQPQWSSYADCQRGYVLTLRRDPEGACDGLK